MSENIEGALIPSLHDEPLDLRMVVDTLTDIPNILYPWVGMLFYVKETKLIYSVYELTPEGGISDYSEFHSSGNISKIIYRGVIYEPSDEGIIDILTPEIKWEKKNIYESTTNVTQVTGKSYNTIYEAIIDLPYKITDGGRIKYKDGLGLWHIFQADELSIGNFDYTEIDTYSEVDYSNSKFTYSYLKSNGDVVVDSTGEHITSYFIFLPNNTDIKFSNFSYKPEDSLGGYSFINIYDKNYSFLTSFSQGEGLLYYHQLPIGSKYIRFGSLKDSGYKIKLVSTESIKRDAEVLDDINKKSNEVEGELGYKEIAEWNRPGLSPDASLQELGSLKIINSKSVYLIDVSDGINVKIVGELKKNNWLRFKEGGWAPVVVISEDQYNASNVALYTDTGGQNLAFAAGSYDPQVWWDTYGGHATSLPTPLYNSNGEEVYCRRPWEDIDKGYDIVVGWRKTFWMIGGEKGRRGQEIYAFFEKETYYDGILAREVEPTGMCPSLPTQIAGKLRSIYCKSGAGTTNYRTPRADLNFNPYPDINIFNRPGFAYPYYNTSGINSMQLSRSRNFNPESPIPCSEGMCFHKMSHIYSDFIKYGTFNFNSYWGHGISSNGGINWGKVTGIRLRQDESSDTYYYSAFSNGYQSTLSGIKSLDGICLFSYNGTSINRDKRINAITCGLAAKERTLESQMSLSIAVECNIPEKTNYFWDEELYNYLNTGISNLLDTNLINASLFKLIPETKIYGFTTDNPSTAEESSILIETILQIPVIEGMVLWGDSYDFGYGGLEVVVDIETPAVSSAIFTNPYKAYLCTKQSDMTFTTISMIYNDKFDFETTYELIGEGFRDSNGWVADQIPYTPIPKSIGGNLISGSCFYAYNYDALGTYNYPGYRIRAGMRGRGDAASGSCTARLWGGYISQNTYYRGHSPTLQVSLK